jgi:3-phenylpropionate/trans-cinnamate dioxygenase ferredoxin subunit
MSDEPILADDSGGRWVAVCTQKRLSEQRIVCGQVAGVGLIIVQDGDRIYACERACPHEQADLSLGRVADGRLHCPRHLAWFDLTDGQISAGWTSPTLRRFPVRADGAEIWVDSEGLRRH